MNIVLIGMSGAGKSTLGVLLAKTLGMDFVDTDILIQQTAGNLLQDIIDTEGTEKFLKVEEKIISGLNLKNSVVATGGSVVYSKKAMEALKQAGRIVYLDVPFREIEKRLRNISGRGIVITKGKGLKDVYAERVPLYQKYGEITVRCAHKDIEGCVREIAHLLGSSTFLLEKS